MGVRLTFRKSFDLLGAAGPNQASLDIYTTDGEPVENVIGCSVDQELGGFPILTLKIRVTETIADAMAAKMKI